jgi:hypothetical protein
MWFLSPTQREIEESRLKRRDMSFNFGRHVRQTIRGAWDGSYLRSGYAPPARRFLSSRLKKLNAKAAFAWTQTFLYQAGIPAAVAVVGLYLVGCASTTYHDPFDRSASPSSQSAIGEVPAGPSVKVLLSGSTAASMRDMAAHSNLGAKMLNPASVIDPIDPKHMEDELNRVLKPYFRNINYVYWNEPDGSKADYLLTLEISVKLASRSFAENHVDLQGVLTGPNAGQKDNLAGHGISKMGFPASTRSFLAARQAAFEEFERSLGNSHLLATFTGSALAPTIAQAPASTSSPNQGVAPRTKEPESPRVRSGIYGVESMISFNVLDSVYFDAAVGQIALVGHRDERYKGPGIPYLQHLATLLESPKPEFSLVWTPDSIRRVDGMLKRELTQRESDEQGARLGSIVDSSGLISRTGIYMLPALGIYPVNDNRAPGDLGVEVKSINGGRVVVMSVKPGSAAERVGLKPPDFIVSVRPDRPAFFASEFTRQVRSAGAGAEVEVTYQRGGQTRSVRATLDAAGDVDPWRGVNRYDLLEMMYRGAGNSSAADVIASMGIMNTVATEKVQTAGFQAYSGLMHSLGMDADFQHLQEVGADSAPPFQDSYNFGLRISQQIDSIFQLAGNPLVNNFKSTVRRTNDPAVALSGVFNEFDLQLKPKVGELIDNLIFRPGVGFQIPPELVEEEYHIHPEMIPQYLGVPSDSQLARLMLAGDYLGKQLSNRQDLKRSIPGYQTQVEYQINHPEAVNRSNHAFRVWISIAGIDAAQSTDARTLALRDARMRFDVRETDDLQNDLPNQRPGGYEDFLTALYDRFELQFPELHELREAAKLAAVSAWMQKQDPAIRLPAEGRAAWAGPRTMKGLVYIYLTVNLKRESKIVKIAEGGVSLDIHRAASTPVIFPVDSSVVDLRGTPSFATLFTRPDGAMVGSGSTDASRYVASWVAPVTGGLPGREAVVLEGRRNSGQEAVTSTFGTRISNPTLTDVDSKAGANGTDTRANHQLNSAAKNAGELGKNIDAGESGSEAARRGFDTGAAEAGAVDAHGVQSPPSEPQEIQIPASMINDKDLAAEMLKLNFYRQQAQQTHDASIAAQRKFEAERNKDPQSAQLSVLLEQAREAQDKARNLDNMVKVTTTEIKRKISFAKVSTDGDGTPAPRDPDKPPDTQPSTGQSATPSPKP